MAKKTKLSSMVAKPGKPVPVTIVSDGPTSSNKDYNKEERRYQAQDDIRTMQRAAEIQKDKERTKAMKEVAKEQMDNLKKIC